MGIQPITRHRAPMNAGRPFTLGLSLICALGVVVCAAENSEASPLTLLEAQERARQISPELLTVTESVSAAKGRERQASHLPNPTLFYDREQTSNSKGTNSQDIVGLEQPIELGGQRRVRQDAATLRREAAEARLEAAKAQLTYRVAHTHAHAIAADQRLKEADAVVEAFQVARERSARRHAQGDISRYERTRIELEAARYAGIRAQAVLEQRTARNELAALIFPEGERHAIHEIQLSDSLTVPAIGASLDALRERALELRPELRAAEFESQASVAEAKLARRQRVPTLVASAGYKNERVADESEAADGFVVGLRVPLPLWDQNSGRIEAKQAEARRSNAELQRLRRDLLLEVETAWHELQAVSEQIHALEPLLGSEAEAAILAANTAYAEGEISLVEWLDAVRAHHEAKSSFATLLSTHVIRNAALERAVGGSLY